MYTGVHVNYPLFLSGLMKLEFLQKCSNKNFMKIPLVGAELFHAGGQTNLRTYRHDKANNFFSQFLRTRIKTIHSQSSFLEWYFCHLFWILHWPAIVKVRCLKYSLTCPYRLVPRLRIFSSFLMILQDQYPKIGNPSEFHRTNFISTFWIRLHDRK